MSNYTDDTLHIPGQPYTVGINDGVTFKRAIFTGYMPLFGKNRMTFIIEGEDGKQQKRLEINPSYNTFTIEEDISMNTVTAEQSDESWTLKQQS
tara:strand:- start:124 stop:405 length:282 start_codon:yes stop_codon:yes gene_type:complete